MSKPMTGEEARNKIKDLMKDIKFALMTSVDESTGRLHARPMTPQNLKEFDGTLWFFTGRDAEKTQELRENSLSQVTFASPGKQDYVVLSGRATVVRDATKIEELWSEPMKAWFPQGKTDPNLTLIRFTTDEAEFWDAPGALATAYAYVKARITGEQPQIGEVGKASFPKSAA